MERMKHQIAPIVALPTKVVEVSLYEFGGGLYQRRCQDYGERGGWESAAERNEEEDEEDDSELWVPKNSANARFECSLLAYWLPVITKMPVDTLDC